MDQGLERLGAALHRGQSSSSRISRAWRSARRSRWSNVVTSHDLPHVSIFQSFQTMQEIGRKSVQGVRASGACRSRPWLTGPAGIGAGDEKQWAGRPPVFGRMAGRKTWRRFPAEAMLPPDWFYQAGRELLRWRRARVPGTAARSPARPVAPVGRGRPAFGAGTGGQGRSGRGDGARDPRPPRQGESRAAGPHFRRTAVCGSSRPGGRDPGGWIRPRPSTLRSCTIAMLDRRGFPRRKFVLAVRPDPGGRTAGGGPRRHPLPGHVPGAARAGAGRWRSPVYLNGHQTRYARLGIDPRHEGPPGGRSCGRGRT